MTRELFSDARFGPVVNLATNPSFETAGSTVEIRRNLHPNPALGTIVDGWANGSAGVGGVSSVVRVAVTGPIASIRYALRKTWTVAPSGSLSYIQFGSTAEYNRIAISPNLNYSNSVYVRLSGLTTTASIRPYFVWWDSAGTYLGEAGGSWTTVTVGDTEWKRLDTIRSLPDGAAFVSCRSYLDTTHNTNLVVEATGALLEASPITGEYFDGAYSPDSDMTPSWLGTAYQSASKLSVTYPAASSRSYASTFPFKSTKWSASGSNSMRIVNTDSNTNISVLIAGNGLLAGLSGQGITFVPGKKYTISAKLALSSPLTGTLGASRLIRVFYSTVPGWTGTTTVDSNIAPNVAGVYDLSVTFTLPLNAVGCCVLLCHGASVGNGDTWWDNLMITEGPNVYRYQDGDSPGWKWTGTAHASASVGWPNIVPLNTNLAPPLQFWEYLNGAYWDSGEQVAVLPSESAQVRSPILYLGRPKQIQARIESFISVAASPNYFTGWWFYKNSTDAGFIGLNENGLTLDSNTWITNNWILNKGPASTSVRTNQATYGKYILGGTAGYSKAGTKYRNPYIALVLP